MGDGGELDKALQTHFELIFLSNDCTNRPIHPISSPAPTRLSSSPSRLLPFHKPFSRSIHSHMVKKHGTGGRGLHMSSRAGPRWFDLPAAIPAVRCRYRSATELPPRW